MKKLLKMNQALNGFAEENASPTGRIKTRDLANAMRSQTPLVKSLSAPEEAENNDLFALMDRKQEEGKGEGVYDVTTTVTRNRARAKESLCGLVAQMSVYSINTGVGTLPQSNSLLGDDSFILSVCNTNPNEDEKIKQKTTKKLRDVKEDEEFENMDALVLSVLSEIDDT